jgi:hypothetical protein
MGSRLSPRLRRLHELGYAAHRVLRLLDDAFLYAIFLLRSRTAHTQRPLFLSLQPIIGCLFTLYLLILGGQLYSTSRIEGDAIADKLLR